ncbi:MAG: energy-coupling factor transporter transmembrane component T family protein [bacterium]
MGSEIYLDLDTVIHRLDPRTKIFLFFTAFGLLVLYEHPLWVLAVSLFIVLQGIMSRSLVNLRRIRYILIVLSLSGVVMWSLFAGGRTKLFWIFELEAVQFGLARTLMILSMITSGMIFISTTRNEEFVLGLIKLGLPYRVGFALSTALRLVPAIASSAVTIGQAQRSRGLDLDSGHILERIRKNIPLLIPVFVSTIRSTNIFCMALEAKGFGARPDRTFYLQVKYQKADYLCLVIALALLVAGISLRVAGYGKIPGLIRF